MKHSFENLSSSCGKDRVIIGGRSKPFVNRWPWYQDLCHWPPIWVDDAKCKRINVDLCFRLSCELFGWMTIAKYQALELVYRAHAGDIEGVVGEGVSVSWVGAWTKGEVHKRKLTNKMFLHSDLLTSLTSSLTPLFLRLENSRCELMR